MVLKPQPGRQTDFLSTPADIAIYGGAAGGGKSYGLLLEAVRNMPNKDYRGIIFRRVIGEFKDGGLWDESKDIFPHIGAKGNESSLTWKSKKGGSLKFSGMQHEKDKDAHQGKQYTFAGFDELTHFTEKQFWYIVSRLRDAKSGIKPYLRATCNPDPDSFVKDLIRWWLDDEGRYPDPEKSGKIRYLYRYNDVIHWADTKKELQDKFDIPSNHIMSFTFIASNIYDNQILMDNDPTYLANLNAQNRVDRERLLKGDWKIRPEAGMYFKRVWFQYANMPPLSSFKRIVRAWDFAGTKKTDKNDPDATSGTLMGITYDLKIIVIDQIHGCFSAGEIDDLVKRTANNDKVKFGNVLTIIPQDPGQAGVYQCNHFTKLLHGFSFIFVRPVVDKVVRAKPYASQVEHGNVYLIENDWNDKYINEHEAFPDSNHDDMVDSSSDAYNNLVGKVNEQTTESFRM